MTFDQPTISAIVYRLAARLVPGWTITCALAKPGDLPAGALAMVDPLPERQTAHVIVGRHPPDEDYEETIAHELTHVMLSPLAQLVKRSSASVMLEEQIVERIGKLLVSAPAKLRRAVASAVSNPRTDSPALRFRISALATRRRTERKRTMADGSRLAELAMKAGEMGAREDVPEDVRALLAEFVAELAGGGAPASTQEPPMREEDPAKPEPQMREDEVPPQMREQYRSMKRAAAMSLDASIGLSLYKLRTVDGLAITPTIEARLRKATSVDDFEERLELVKVSLGSANEQKRNRSGATPDTSDANGAPSFESMVADGIPEAVASQVRREFARGKDYGNTALTAARRYRKGAANG